MLPNTEIVCEVDRLKDHFSLYYQETAEQAEVGGIRRFHSLIRSPYNNVIIGVPCGNWDETVAAQIAFFKGPWVWYIDEKEEKFKEKLLAWGFEDQGTLLGMVGSLDKLPSFSINQDFHYEKVEGKAALQAFNETFCTVFNLTEPDKTTYMTLMGKSPYMVHWIAKKGDRVVSTLTLVQEEDILSFWNGATLPEYRRQGVSTSLRHVALQDAIAKGSKVGASFLLPEGLAYGICTKLGFKPIWRFSALKRPERVVYKGLTEKELLDAYNDDKTIPNFDALVQENRKQAQTVKARLNPILDTAYGSESIQKLDIYAPKNLKNMPVIIHLHGGGWTVGSKNPWAIPAESLMEKGILSVSVDYGLAPQYQMQDMVAHVRQAISWVYNNIASYGGDPNRLYISGVSAGAHLASTALMPNWHEDFDLPEDVIKGLIALSGIYDLGTLVHAPQADSQKALQMTPEEAQNDSPLYHLPKHSIPAIIAYGEKEPLILYHFEAGNYAQELRKAGCQVSLIEVPHANHFDMINELANTEGSVFRAMMQMLF